MSEQFTTAQKLETIQAISDAPENTDAILASRNISHAEFNTWLLDAKELQELRAERIQELRRATV